MRPTPSGTWSAEASTWAPGANSNPCPRQKFLRTAAFAALVEAPTARTASILLDQFHGAFSQAVVAIEEAVEAIDEVAAHYERHAHAARDIAAEYFDSTKVLVDED